MKKILIIFTIAITILFNSNVKANNITIDNNEKQEIRENNKSGVLFISLTTISIAVILTIYKKKKIKL